MAYSLIKTIPLTSSPKKREQKNNTNLMPKPINKNLQHIDQTLKYTLHNTRTHKSSCGFPQNKKFINVFYVPPFI